MRALDAGSQIRTYDGGTVESRGVLVSVAQFQFEALAWMGI